VQHHTIQIRPPPSLPHYLLTRQANLNQLSNLIATAVASRVAALKMLSGFCHFTVACFWALRNPCTCTEKIVIVKGRRVINFKMERSLKAKYVLKGKHFATVSKKDKNSWNFSDNNEVAISTLLKSIKSMLKSMQQYILRFLVISIYWYVYMYFIHYKIIVHK